MHTGVLERVVGVGKEQRSGREDVVDDGVMNTRSVFYAANENGKCMDVDHQMGRDLRTFRDVLGFGKHGLGRRDKVIEAWLEKWRADGKGLEGILRREWVIANGNSGEKGEVMVANYQTMTTTVGHLLPVYCAIIDHTGHRLITGADDFIIKIWQITSGKLIKTLRGHSSVITDLALSPDNEFLISSSHDRSVRVWSFPDGNPIAVLRGHAKEVMRVSFAEFWKLKKLISIGLDGFVCFWNVSEWKSDRPNLYIDLQPENNRIHIEDHECNWISINPNCREIALCLTHGLVQLYSMDDMRLLASDRLHIADVVRAQFSSKITEQRGDVTIGHVSFLLLTLGHDGSAVISLRKGSIILTIAKFWLCNNSGRPIAIFSGMWNHDESLIVLAGSKFVSIFSVKDCRQIRRYEHQNDVTVLCLHPVFDWAISGGSDGFLHFFDIQSGSMLQSIQIMNIFADLVFNRDGSVLIFTTDSGRIFFLAESNILFQQDLQEVPEYQFFEQDYAEMKLDAMGNAIEVSSQAPFHLLPRGFLVDLSGLPYVVQPRADFSSSSFSIASDPGFLEHQRELEEFYYSYRENFHVDDIVLIENVFEPAKLFNSPNPKKRKRSIVNSLAEIGDIESDGSAVASLNFSFEEEVAKFDDSDFNPKDDDDEDALFDYPARRSNRRGFGRSKSVKERNKRPARKSKKSKLVISEVGLEDYPDQIVPVLPVEILEDISPVSLVDSREHWLEAVEPSKHTYIPQLLDEAVLYFQGFLAVDPKQARGIMSRFAGYNCLLFQIVRMSYGRSKTTNFQFCELECKVLRFPNRRRATIQNDVANFFITLNPHDEVDFIVLFERVETALNRKLTPGMKFFTSFANQAEPSPGVIFEAKEVDFDNAWNSVQVNWIGQVEVQSVDVLSPWELEFDTDFNRIPEQPLLRSAFIFMKQRRSVYLHLENLSFLPCAFPISSTIIFFRLFNSYYRHLESFLYDLYILRSNLENSPDVPLDLLSLAIRLESSIYFRLGINYPSALYPLIASSLTIYEDSIYPLVSALYRVVAVSEDSMIVHLTKRRPELKSLYRSDFRYAVGDSLETGKIRICRILPQSSEESEYVEDFADSCDVLEDEKQVSSPMVQDLGNFVIRVKKFRS